LHFSSCHLLSIGVEVSCNILHYWQGFQFLRIWIIAAEIMVLCVFIATKYVYWVGKHSPQHGCMGWWSMAQYPK
jgi:hypothetical protein